MRFCKKCIEPDTRPGAEFDEEGICLPCRYREQPAPTDIWAQRHKQLEDICDWAKKETTINYDCIIPVSGGKDSLRQALYMRDNLGMNPLLVSCAYPPEQQTDRGAHNMANLIKLGFDAYYISPSPQTWKKLVRFCFEKFGNIFKSSELALYSTAPKVALSMNIPLLVYGENPGLMWGGTVHSLDGNGIKLKYSNTLQGGNLNPYHAAGFLDKDLYWYHYPSDDELEDSGTRIIYLGYYIPDFNDDVNSSVAIANGLQVREGEDADPEMTGSITNFAALDDDFVIVNQMLKYFKFGFGLSTEQLSGFIRDGRITREEAVKLANRIDGNCADKYIRKFCKFVGISEDHFWEVADSYRDLTIWEQDQNGWRLKQPLE